MRGGEEVAGGDRHEGGMVCGGEGDPAGPGPRGARACLKTFSPVRTPQALFCFGLFNVIV